jgi:para-nitrobenzyl esterase
VDGALRARGLSYASAIRFEVPRPVERTSEVRDATTAGAACPQTPSRLDRVMGSTLVGLSQSEDCLVLSVTAPVGAPLGLSRLPVMVWFHGGAYMSGSGEADKYDPTALVVEGNVVVVNVSYRLGIFGYAPPRPAGGGGPQNLGLRDQVLAVRWVSRNISAFGGDPDTVTLFGQSAGGDSVLSLILSEETDGLFRRAIVQSAPVGLRSQRSAMHDAIVAAVTRVLGPTAATGVPGDVLAAQPAALEAAESFRAMRSLPFGPVYGADPLPAEDDEDRRIAEVAPRVDLLVTHAANDAMPFVLLDPRGAALAGRGRFGAALLQFFARRATRLVFGRPARDLTASWVAAGGQAAHYVFNWAVPGNVLGACHCIELPLLFGSGESWSDAKMLEHDPGNIDETVARRIRAAWAAFAREGTFPATTRDLHRVS